MTTILTRLAIGCGIWLALAIALALYLGPKFRDAMQRMDAGERAAQMQAAVDFGEPGADLPYFVVEFTSMREW